MDKTHYFTLYSLGKVAKAFREPIRYDRTKVAIRLYCESEELGFVKIKKIKGDTYVTTTDEGDKICLKILPELITLNNIRAIAPQLVENTSENDRFIKKGGSRFTNDDQTSLKDLKDVVKKLLFTTEKLNRSYSKEIFTTEERDEDIVR